MESSKSKPQKEEMRSNRLPWGAETWQDICIEKECD